MRSRELKIEVFENGLVRLTELTHVINLPCPEHLPHGLAWNPIVTRWVEGGHLDMTVEDLRLEVQ